MTCLHPSCPKETGTAGFCEKHWRALTPDLRVAYTEARSAGYTFVVERRIHRYFKIRERLAELVAS